MGEHGDLKSDNTVEDGDPKFDNMVEHGDPKSDNMVEHGDLKFYTPKYTNKHNVKIWFTSKTYFFYVDFRLEVLTFLLLLYQIPRCDLTILCCYGCKQTPHVHSKDMKQFQFES